MAQIEELLDEMEDILADGKGKAFSNRMTVDVEALKTVIDDLRFSVPEEVKQARILASERREIMSRANREAGEIIEDARIKSRDLLAAAEHRARENDVETNRRNEELIKDAQERAKSILDSARTEADKLVSSQNILEEAKTASKNLTPNIPATGAGSSFLPQQRIRRRASSANQRNRHKTSLRRQKPVPKDLSRKQSTSHRAKWMRLLSGRMTLR